MAAVAQYGRILEDQKLRPIITINRKVANSFLSQSPAVGAITGRMVQILNNYPHFFVLRGPPPIETPDLTVAIARAIASVGPHPFIRSSDRLGRVTLTRVEIDAEATDFSGIAQYSRTNQPLRPHTDSSQDSVPHELVALQMVRPDFQGGKTVVAPIEDILSDLSEPEIAALHRTKMPFGPKPLPVLWRNRAVHHIRFCDQEVMAVLRKGGRSDDAIKNALRPLLGALEKVDQFQQFDLGAGETLFLHNTRALHGRTGFAPDSKRLLFRIRMYAGSLA